MTDNRAKAVRSALIDKVSTTFSLKNLLTDMNATGELGKGDTVEIPTRSAVQIEQVSTGTGALAMSVQTNTATPNELKIDQHYGAIVEIGKMNEKYDLNGTWAPQLASQVKIELDTYIGTDVFKRALLYQGAWAAGSTAPSTWVNPTGVALTQDMTELALAQMLNQKGVTFDGLEWILGPFGVGSLRRIAGFNAATPVGGGSLGMRQVGELHGIPVRVTQVAPESIAVATTAVVVASNVATATVAAGHGIVAGMPLTSAGHTVNATTAVAVTSTTETTVVYPLTTGDATLADGVGVLTVNMSIGGLVYKPWAFFAEGKVPTVNIYPRTGGKIVDELQAEAFWGSKGLPGCFVAIGSPRRAFT